MDKFLHLEDVTHPTAVLFGERVRERRKALGLTQTQLFDLTGITPGYLSNLENGRANPTLDMMLKLAEAIGLDVWEMLRPHPVQGKGRNS